MPEYTVDTVDVVSLAKILGIVGLLWGIVVGVSWIVLGSPFGRGPRLRELLFVIFTGVIYGLAGGGITAIVYNLAASVVGGIELELSE